MRRVRFASAIAGLALLAACANPKAGEDTPPLSFAPQQPVAPDILKKPGETLHPPSIAGSLAGRTLHIGKVSDIRLAPREVVLTFDDGPMPRRTPAILDTLDRFGVKATFLMVGSMARSYPGLVREVAARGHSIGSHTQNHANLRNAGYARAVAEIEQGRASINGALGPARFRAAPFFRFPYLADTPALRSHLAASGIVVIDSQVDSKDYFQSSPDQVRQRVMARLGSNGSGIILMHDIHARTAAMLPSLLSDLRSRGFTVVHLAPGRPGVPNLLASAN